MSRPITVLSIGVIVAVLIGGPALVLTRSAAAMSAADKAARKHATATCRAAAVDLSIRSAALASRAAVSHSKLQDLRSSQNDAAKSGSPGKVWTSEP